MKIVKLVGRVVVLALCLSVVRGQAGVALPTGYERLEAVESTGSQFLDTGYAPLVATPFVVELTGCWTGASQNGGNTHELFGTLGSKNNDETRYDFGRTYNAGTPNSWNIARAYSNQADTQEHLFTVNYATGAMMVDGVTKATWSIPSSRSNAGNSFYLFGRHDSSNSCKSRFRLRACRFLQGGVIVRDFVPVKRITDNVVGLFDFVESRFYAPNGTLTGLAYAPNLRLNYIDSDATQYIDTGYTPLATTAFAFELKGGWTKLSTGTGSYQLFGNLYDGESRYDFGLNRQNYFCFGAAVSTVLADTAEHLYVGNYKTGVMTRDGTTIATDSAQTKNARASFFLFNRRNKNNGVNCPSRFRLRSCKLTQDGTIVRDFVAGLSTSGAAGVMDLANGNTHYPKATGNEFAWGYAYLEKDGGESVYVGTLTAADMSPARDFEKEGFRSVSAAAVTQFPVALTLTRGELSFADGTVRTHEVVGALTLKGGTSLVIDMTAAGCDCFRAGSLVFDASATAVDPVIVKVNDVVGLTALTGETALPFLSATGQTFTEADAAKFRVEGFGAEVAAVNGALVLRAVPVSSAEWTGAEGDGKWSTAGNWLDNALPRNGGVVRFDTAAGGALTMDIPGLSIASFTAGSSAGAFVQGGIEMLAVANALTNNSAAVQSFTLPMELGAEGEPLVFATTGDLALTGGVKRAVSANLVKTGAGVLHVNDEVVAQATNVTVEAGVLRLERTGRVTGISAGGAITIRPGAQLDIHTVNSGANLSYTEAVHGKTLHIAGSGPAGSKGAIDNSLVVASWGCNFGKIILDADATVGGGWMGLRTLSGSAFTDAALEGPHTLTVRNEMLFNICGASVALDRLDVRGVMSFETSVSGAITNGIHCYSNGKLRFVGIAAGTTFPVVVEESGAIVQSDSNNSSFASALTVKPGVASVFRCEKNLTLSGAVTNAGAVAQTEAGVLTLAGSLIGNGSFAGAKVRFGGTANCWEIEVDDAGATSKIDFEGVTDTALFTGLKTVAVRTIGTSTEIQTVDLGPAGALTERQAANIVLTVTNAQGGTVPNCRLDVADGRLVLTLRDSSLVRTAVWTGAGTDATNFADPGNWTCRNDQGRQVDDGLPGEHTILEITNGSTFNCPLGTSLTYLNVRFASAASLADDCDWSGLDLTRVLEGGTLDLAGHDLQVTASANLATAFTITDSTVTSGALRLAVPEGTTVQNTGVTLTGSLRLVKTGAGTLTAAKTGQSYSGGTEVEGGTLNLPVSGSSGSTYAAKNRLFGAMGSSITVDAGATFDIKGNYDYYQHPILLDGGTLANTGCDMGKMLSDGYASTGNVTLLADSFCYATYRIRFTEGVIDLGGHRLTATFSSTFFHLDGEPGRYCNVSNGTLVVNATADGYFNLMGKSSFTRDMRTVDIDLNAPLYINAGCDLQVRNLTVRTTANKGSSAGKTFIYGVYTPVSSYMYNFVLQNGSTLNLRDKSGAWSANPDAALTACNTLAFEEGACVRVDLTGRTLRNGECIISWDASKVPLNVDTVDFKLVGGMGTLYLEGNGIYVRRGLTILIR